MKIDTRTASFIDEFITSEISRDTAFKSAYEDEVRAEQIDLETRAAVSSQLVSIRKRRNLRQDVIAKRIGVTQSRVSQIEHLRDGVTFDAVLEYARQIGAEIRIVPKDNPISDSPA